MTYNNINRLNRIQVQGKKLVKIPQIPEYGKSIEILIDLGNCFGLTSGYNSITRNNVYEYINLASNNINSMEQKASEYYINSLCILKETLNRISDIDESIRFGSLCQEYYAIKENRIGILPKEKVKFMSYVTKGLGKSAEVTI